MAARRRTLNLVLMGVSGCGKSAVAAALATRLEWPVCEGDDLHPTANLAKMAAGRPLTDADRAPWLHAIRRWLHAHDPAIVTCSALKRSYRDVLRGDNVRFVWLDAPREVLAARLARRTGHFMPPNLLDSQLAMLEPPGPDEAATRLDVSTTSPDDLAALVINTFAVRQDEGADSSHETNPG